LVGQIIKPGFFDNDGRCVRNGTAGSFEAVLAEFFDDFALSDGELAGFEIGASAGGIFPSFLWETSKRIVNPEMFRGGEGLRVFHRVFHRVDWGGFCEFLEEFAEEDGSVTAVATELDEIAFGATREGLLGEAKDFGGLLGSDLVIHVVFGVLAAKKHNLY